MVKIIKSLHFIQSSDTRCRDKGHRGYSDIRWDPSKPATLLWKEASYQTWEDEPWFLTGNFHVLLHVSGVDALLGWEIPKHPQGERTDSTKARFQRWLYGFHCRSSCLLGHWPYAVLGFAVVNLNNFLMFSHISGIDKKFPSIEYVLNTSDGFRFRW